MCARPDLNKLSVMKSVRPFQTYTNSTDTTKIFKGCNLE